MSKYFYYLADENRLSDNRMEELSKMEPMQTFDEMLEECGIWLGPSWLAAQIRNSNYNPNAPLTWHI